MKLNAKSRLLASSPKSLAQWKKDVTKLYPKAKFVLEDGSGKTYGEEGSWTAATGPDMQGDVVGVYSPKSVDGFCWIQSKDGDQEEYEVTSSTEDPLSTGVAFDTLIDGKPEEIKPLVQELTDNDGDINEAEEKRLLIDDLPV